MEQLHNKVIGVYVKKFRIFVASNFNLIDYLEDNR